MEYDRVLLSTHMEKHWKEIGFTPDSNELVEEAEDDLEIQIGRTNIEKQINQGPDLTNRYSSIIISGFTADQNLPDIHSLLLGQGLPQTTKSEDLQQNLASGRVTINDLSPTDCLTIMERMHGKKVYVNSVVSASPVKAPAVPVPNSPPQPPPLPSSLSPKRILPIKIKFTPTLVPTCTNFRTVPVVIIQSGEDASVPDLEASSDSGSDTDSDPDPSPSPISPNIQAKINVFDFPVQSSKFFRKPSQAEKRKKCGSPELTRAEKKNKKKERKRMRKLEHQHHEQIKI